MSKRFLLSLFLVAGISAGPARAQSLVPIDPATITNGNVYLMNNVGANVPDDSANNTNGILIGSPQSVAGLNGKALKFNGTSDGVNPPDATTLNTSTHQNKTVIAVFNCADVSKTAKQCVYEEGGSTRGLTIYVHQGKVYAAGWNRGDYTPQWNPGTFLSAPIGSNQWHVVAAVLRGGTAGQTNDKFEMWLDGTPIGKGPGGEFRSRSDDNGIGTVQAQTNFHDGTVTAPGYWFEGMIDEIWILNQALSESVLSGIGLNRTLAANPVPAAGAADVLRDGILSWDAGEFAQTHDVYLGATFADVNSASRTSAKGVLASQGQTETTYDPAGLFTYGQTYYWRIDEVNKTPDNTVFKGDVWSFTVEPYGYPIQPVAATASSFQAGMGPEKTIDGSGLTGDLHGTVETTMWLSAGTPPNWIQYEFDQVYKLHQLTAWNSNQMVESFLGFGAKQVTIETSPDGTTWKPVANVPEFARASGAAGYAANTTVNLGGAQAKYVKLMINASWGGMPTTGLSEVRFSYVPTQARTPQPATAATGVSVGATLNWRPGREAASHKVFFGTDPNAVAQGTVVAQSVTEHSYAPDSLTFGTKYYWKVDEVNAVTYPGEVWSFTTEEYRAVEDFESYTDKAGEEVFAAWVDGMVNGNGSIVGLYPDAVNGTFCERVIIHGGKQSMPFEYNNVKTPYYSEAERTFDAPQNWTGNGADTLVVHFRGQPMAFQENAAGTIVMSGGGTDIWNTADQFRFAGKRLSGNGTIVAKVESLVNTDPWAKVGVMIRESLDPGARFAAVYATPGNGVRYQARLTASAAATSDTAVVTTEQTALRAPVWVKIERSGTAFNGFYSTDGVKWTAMSWNPQTINVTAASIYIGLAVTSHNANAATTAEFSNIATTGSVTGAWEVAAIGVAQPANAPAPLYLIVQDTAGKSKVVSHPDPLATTAATWQAWQIPLSELSAAGVKLTAVKKMMLGVGEKAGPKPGGAGKLHLDDIGFGHPVQPSTAP